MRVDRRPETFPVGSLIHTFLQGEPLVHDHLIAHLLQRAFEIGCTTLLPIVTSGIGQLETDRQLQGFVQFDQTRTTILEALFTLLQIGVDAQIALHLVVKVVHQHRFHSHLSVG